MFDNVIHSVEKNTWKSSVRNKYRIMIYYPSLCRENRRGQIRYDAV